MFLGQYQSALSPKRRVVIPKPFRESLGEKVIIARWYETCLVLVSSEGWEKLMMRLTAQSQIITEPVRDTDRFILGSAFELFPDEQGRVVLPFILSSYAKLTSEVIFLGLADRIEIWDKKSWQEREELISENASELIEKIAAERKEEK